MSLYLENEYEISALSNSIRDNYEIIIDRISIINGGFLNKKYLVVSNNMRYVAKVLSNVKFPTNKELSYPINAIKYQKYLCDNNVLVPKIVPNKSGELYTFSTTGECYFLQEYVDGTTLKYNQLSLDLIEEIGVNLAKLHFESNKFTKIDDNMKFCKINKYEELLVDAKKRINEMSDFSSERMKMIVSNQNAIIEDIKNLQLIEKFDLCYIHNDLTADNIIFNNGFFKCIIDFEMSRVNSPLQDIGRFLLAVSFDGDSFNSSKVKAFLKGYNRYYKIGLYDLVKALQIVWINESGIWLVEKLYHMYNPPKVQKFILELEWITENWFNLLDKLESDIYGKK